MGTTQRSSSSSAQAGVAAEGAVVFVALQILEQLGEAVEGLAGQGGLPEGVAAQGGQVRLRGGQLTQGLLADVEHVPGVGPGGHGPVKGVFPDEIERAPAQGIDLVAHEDVAGTGKGEEQLVVVVEVQTAHIPGVVVIELKMKVHAGHGPGPPFEQDTHIIARQENICKLFAKL